MWRGNLYWLGVILLLLMGCDAPSTPVAAVVPPTVTPAPVADATQPPPLRYGMSPLLQRTFNDGALQSLRDIALVETWNPADDPAAYDLVAAYGSSEGWQMTPTGHEQMLLFNDSLAPFDDERLRGIIQQAVNTDVLAAETSIAGVAPAVNAPAAPALLRTELANLGYPDGFVIVIAYTDELSLAALRSQLAAINVESRAVRIESSRVLEPLADDTAHIVLARATSADQQAQWQANGTAQLLYTLPIRYIARDDLAITFTPQGLPLPRRD